MLKLYNTLSRAKEEFRPLHDKTVKLYACGPTVYNYAHIGNLRTYIFEDILVRALKYNGFDVKHVMNITDVGHLTDDADMGEDKIEAEARIEKKSAWEIAEFYTGAFKNDMRDLNIREPNIWAKATDHIPEQIALVQTLMDKGYTYETSDGIYFDTTKLDEYGKLAQLEKQELKAGARVEMGEKRNQHDFALWKFSDPKETRQMEWDAPFGSAQGKSARKGFPGWHIECSAMAMKYLGEQFDIHCGGIDLIPVHHTNEIAQSESATGKKPWVSFWVHGEFLLVDAGPSASSPSASSGSRMGKSEGNFITLQTLKDRGYSPLAYRYFVLQAHYRQQLAFSWEALDAAAQGLKRIKLRVQEIPPHTPENPHLEQEFLDTVNDDLNTPAAIALLWEAIKDHSVNLETVIKFDKILGLNLHEVEQEAPIEIPVDVQKLLDERAEARKNEDWVESDRLREEIARLGFTVEDTEEGPHVTRNT